MFIRLTNRYCKGKRRMKKTGLIPFIAVTLCLAACGADKNNEELKGSTTAFEIAKGNDGKYIVQIGIYRLTSLEDGVGELTADGLLFTATDAAGNPISDIITADGKTATVTFTDFTLCTRKPDSGIWGRGQTIFVYLNKLDSMPDLTWLGVPLLLPRCG